MDVLPGLTEGDFCSQRRTSATVYVIRRIGIAIVMRTATTPDTRFRMFSKHASKVCDTLRPRIRLDAASRAKLVGEPFIDFFEPHARRNRHVLKCGSQ